MTHKDGDIGISRIQGICYTIPCILLFIAAIMPEHLLLFNKLDYKGCKRYVVELGKAEDRFYNINGYYTKKGLWPYFKCYRVIHNDYELEDRLKRGCDRKWSLENNILLDQDGYKITGTNRGLIKCDIIVTNEYIYPNKISDCLEHGHAE